MKRLSIVLSLILVDYLCCWGVDGRVVPPRMSVQWPAFQQFRIPRSDSERRCIPRDLRLSYQSTAFDDDNKVAIETAFDEMLSELRQGEGSGKECTSWVSPEVELYLNGRDDPALAIEVNASFKLTIGNREGAPVTIEADNSWGIRAGIVMLHNLMQVHTENVQGPGERASNVVDLEDKSKNYYYYPYAEFSQASSPRLAYRGLMIDTARNYVRVETVKRILRVMSRSLLNVLHWHATDDQSFPLVMTKSAPLIHGAECLSTGVCRSTYSSSQMYTMESIKEVIEYAYYHGVVVIMGVTAPTHARSWSESSRCDTESSQKPSICDAPPCGLLDIHSCVRPDVLPEDILEAVLQDIVHLTKSSTPIHVGLAPVTSACWSSSENKEVSTTWTATVAKKLAAVNRQGVVWDTGRLPIENEYALQVTDAASLERLDIHRKVILSIGNQARLDLGRAHDFMPFQRAPLQRTTWWDFYSSYPEGDLSPTNKGQVYGAEALMWTHTADSLNIESLIWPTALGAAGGFWELRDQHLPQPDTPATVVPYVNAVDEIMTFVDMLKNFEPIPIRPLRNKYCSIIRPDFCRLRTTSEVLHKASTVRTLRAIVRTTPNNTQQCQLHQSTAN